MKEPLERRATTTIGIWRETIKLLDRICRKNARVPTRSHRRSRAEELHHLVVKQAVELGLLNRRD